MLHWLIGRPFLLPAELLASYPELREARWRRGGLALRIGGWCLGRRTVSGITLWRTIWLADHASLSPELLLHELRHVHQFQDDRLFPLRYLWRSVRHGYTDNPYESDARTTRPIEWPARLPPCRGSLVVNHTATSVVTIERFIIEQERLHPEATGELSGILYDMALAAKMIANKVRRAGLVDILGATENSNVQGEIQQKLDIFANDTIVKAMDHGGRLCAMASEEEPGLIQIPDGFRCGKYCLLFDPLDGSSNIDVNVPVGTIFSVVQKITRGRHGEMEDMLQPGRRQVASGYVIYGSSTMLVYTTGQGVHGFTLDPSIGEFLLSHPNIRIPDEGRYLSVNDSYEGQWDEPTKQLMRRYRGLEGGRRPLNVRYVGSLVADFHRNLLGGGVFCYPTNKKNPHGKLRLLYEANPLAFICEQAGGAASDGTQRILDVQPQELHQRIPLFVGSRRDVDLAVQTYAKRSELVGA
jgi:fructose-1,6-bisphosphatase I